MDLNWSDNPPNAEPLRFKDALTIVLVNIVQPSFDVYSDVALVTLLLSLDATKYASVINFAILLGYVMVAIIVISMIFIIPHWLECERTWKRRLMTLPLVILLFYPQYRACRVLWLGFYKKDSERARDEKAWNERNIANVGKLRRFID